MTTRGKVNVNWTEEEIRRVTSLFERRVPNDEIAEIMHRTRSAIRNIKQRLRFSATRAPYKPVRHPAPCRIVEEPQPGDEEDYCELSIQEGPLVHKRFIEALVAAGHVHGTGEMNITPDSISPMWAVRPAQVYSSISSPAAMCAEIQG